MRIFSRLNDVFSGVFGAYINSVVGLSVILVQSALAVRYLPKEQTGLWMLMLSFVTILSLSDFGLSPTLSRFVSFSLHLSKKNLRIGLFLKATKRVNFILSSVSLICISLFLFLFIFSKQKHASHVVYMSVVVFIVAIYFRLLSNPNLAFLFGLKKVALSYRLRTRGNLVNLFVLVTLCLFKKSLLNFPLAMLAQYILLYSLSLSHARKQIGRIRRKFSVVHFKKMFDNSLRVFLMGVGAYIIYELNVPLLSIYLNLTAVTQFAIILQVVILLVLMSLITMSSVLPYVSSMYARQQYGQLKEFVYAGLKFNMFLVTSAVVFLYFHAQQFFGLWLGPNYLLNKPLFFLLLIECLFQVQDSTLSSIALACGHLKFVATTLISGCINVILLVIMLPKFGVVSVGISMLVVRLLVNNWYAIFVICKRLDLEITVLELLRRYVLPYLIYLMLLVVFVTFYKKTPYLNVVNKKLFILSFIVTILISAILAFWVFISKSERRQFKQIIKNKILRKDADYEETIRTNKF